MSDLNIVDPPSNASVRSFLERQLGSLVDGAWTTEAKEGHLSVLNPATGQTFCQLPKAGSEQVELAVKAARASFDDGRWSTMLPERRREILRAFAALIETHADALAHLEVLDNGMPLGFAEWEMRACIDWLRHFAGETTRLFGRHASAAMCGDGAEYHGYSNIHPVGVAALIIPWNAPAGSLMIKLAPALAAGCSVIAKPAAETPLAAIRLGELALEAGVPSGVFNVIVGSGRVVGQALAEHPDVDKISFTGSTQTGRGVVRAATGNLKRVTLELGGKSPVLVFNDADLETAIPQAAMAMFANTGQVCFAGSRLFVQSGVYDQVMDGLVEQTRSMKVGSGFDRETVLGPVVSQKQIDQISYFIDRGRAEGAAVLCGGRQISASGYFIEPTIFANVNRDMEIVREEIFGPVLVVTPFDDPEEAIVAANDTRYGLGAGIFSENINTAHKVAKRIKAGNVWVNCYGVNHPSLPFGGFKESGWGREMGEEVMAAFTEKQSVVINLK